MAARVPSVGFDMLVFPKGQRVSGELLQNAYVIYSKSFPADQQLSYKEFADFSHLPGEKTYLVLAIEKGGKRVVAGSFFAYFPKTSHLHCGLMYVDPSWRGKRIGNSFFKRAERSLLSRHKNAEYFTLQTESAIRYQEGISPERRLANFKRERFWERLGFLRLNVPLPTGSIKGSNAFWDLRVKTYGHRDPNEWATIERKQAARLLIDINRLNPGLRQKTELGVFLSPDARRQILRELGAKHESRGFLLGPPFRLKSGSRNQPR